MQAEQRVGMGHAPQGSPGALVVTREGAALAGREGTPGVGLRGGEIQRAGIRSNGIRRGDGVMDAFSGAGSSPELWARSRSQGVRIEVSPEAAWIGGPNQQEGIESLLLETPPTGLVALQITLTPAQLTALGGLLTAA